MALYIDEKFSKILPLQGLELKGSGRYAANFRCNVCHDSKKSKSKKRAYFERHNGDLVVHCYNCGYRSIFRYFLKEYFPSYYQDYLKESFQEYKEERTITAPKSSSIQFMSHSVTKLDLQTLDELPGNHRAVIYVEERRIPKRFWSDIYYADNFIEWAHKKQPTKFEKPVKEDKRIMFVMRDFNGDILGISARTITNNKPKYLTLKFNDDANKFFGLDRLNVSNTIYVFEGSLDSVFIDNSMAVIGAASGCQKLIQEDEEGKPFLPKDKLVIVADNEPRSVQTTGFIEKALKLGFKAVIWPNNWIYKDINSAIMDGYSQSYIKGIIDDNTFEGTSGLVRLKLWKKC